MQPTPGLTANLPPPPGPPGRVRPWPHRPHRDGLEQAFPHSRWRSAPSSPPTSTCWALPKGVGEAAGVGGLCQGLLDTAAHAAAPGARCAGPEAAAVARWAGQAHARTLPALAKAGEHAFEAPDNWLQSAIACAWTPRKRADTQVAGPVAPGKQTLPAQTTALGSSPQAANRPGSSGSALGGGTRRSEAPLLQEMPRGSHRTKQLRTARPQPSAVARRGQGPATALAHGGRGGGRNCTTRSGPPASSLPSTVCAALLGFARDARELTPLPIENRGFVPFARPPFGLLGAPTEPLAQEAADVVVVKANAEVTVDDVANASGGPERSGPQGRAVKGGRLPFTDRRSRCARERCAPMCH
jgi:hypothetical protein